LYATNGKDSTFDIIEPEDIVKIKEFVDHKVKNVIDPYEKPDEMINANTKIQNVKDHGHLQTGYNDKSGPQRVLTANDHEQTQTRQEQDTLQLSNIENGKNEVNGLIGYFFQYYSDPIDLNIEANMYSSNVSNCTFIYENFVKVKKQKLLTSLFCVTPDHYRHKRKWVPISWSINLIL